MKVDITFPYNTMIAPRIRNAETPLRTKLLYSKKSTEYVSSSLIKIPKLMSDHSDEEEGISS